MAKPASIAALLRRRRVWIASCSVLMVVLVGLLLLSQRHWRERAAVLEHENTGLQLTQLAHDLNAESTKLIERARDLAASDAAAGLVQDAGDASAQRLELADMSRKGIDALVVLTASHALRFSVAITDGKISEQPPDPVLLQFTESLATSAADAANRSPQLASFTEDRWIVARPVVSRAFSTTILGWVVVSR